MAEAAARAFPRALLRDACGALGVPLTDAHVDAFERYHALLAKWADAVNLTAIRDPAGVAIKHFADSLALVPLLADARRLLDVGAGAGLPGIPLAIVRADLHVTLVEPRAKRAAFLREAARSLRLADVQVWETRIEQIEPPGDDAGGEWRFDAAVQRAALGPEEFLRHTAPWLAAGGAALLMQGPTGREPDDDAVREGGYEPAPVRTFKLPVVGDARRIRVYIKR